jgi:mRNA interferase MazF
MDRLRRGDVVVVSLSGDYGKPRPALVVQSDLFDKHASVTLAPVTSSIVDAPLFRLTLEPAAQTGLRSVSQVMIDKVTTVKRDKVSKSIGRIDDEVMLRVNRAIALWFGLTA